MPASSVDDQEDEMPPVGTSHPTPQLPDVSPVSSTPEARVQERVDTTESPQGRSLFRKWLQRKSNGDPTSPKPRRLSGKSREAAGARSPSHLPARVNATKGPSWMAAGKRKPVRALP